MIKTTIINNINKDKLLQGSDFKLTNSITLRHPTVQEVVDLEEEYHNYCNPFIFKTEDYRAILYDNGIKYFDVTTWDIFLQNYITELYSKNQNKDNKCPILNAINWWCNNSNYDFILGEEIDNNENKKVILLDKETSTTIDIDVFNSFVKYIKTINCIVNENRYNKNMSEGLLKKLVMQDKKRFNRESKKSYKYQGFLHDYINSIAWGNSVGINIFNIYNLKIYQFYTGLDKLQQIK